MQSERRRPLRGRQQFRAILCLCSNKDVCNLLNFSNPDAANNVSTCIRIRSLEPQASNLRSRRPHEEKAPRTIFKITFLF